MQTQTPQLSTNIAAGVHEPFASASALQTLFTVEQFARVEPAFTSAALRNLIFKAQSRKSTKGEISGNGLIECGAVIRTGRKVMIHRERFLAWVQK